jgi:hypothetical protein
MPCFYDIGRNLDHGLAAQRVYNSFEGLSNRSIIVDLYKMNDAGNISLGGISGREATLLKRYNRETGRKICMINIETYCDDTSVIGYGDIGENYRSKIREDYGIETPFIEEVFGNVSKLSASNVVTAERIDKYWKTVALIYKANPDYTIYCTMIFADNPFEREYVIYESNE